MTALAEELEEFLKLTALDHRDLELEKRILARIHVHRMDLGWTIEQIVERIAASAGDHHQAAVRPEIQHLTI
jgi:hypothetical protein